MAEYVMVREYVAVCFDAAELRAVEVKECTKASNGWVFGMPVLHILVPLYWGQAALDVSMAL